MRMERHRVATDDSLNPSSSHIDDLPEEIQTLVLSLLSLKEAARTSIVSRKWRPLWTRHPNLSFDGTRNRSNDEDCVKIERAEFIETVNSIVQQHSGVGLNRFCIRCGIEKESSDHLDRWICFATAARAKTIDINLLPKGCIRRPTKGDYHFPLEALGARDGPFIQSLLLTHVSIEPYSDVCGFTKLRRLLLHSVQITGDLAGLLLNCSSLEDLELIACSGLTDLIIPHQLDKLRHLLLSGMCVQMVDFHVPGLAHFNYKGDVVPIALHGCSKLEKAIIMFKNYKVVGHAFTAIHGISAVKVLNMRAAMQEDHPVWGSQVQMVTRPTCMFMSLRHLTCEIKIHTYRPNSHSGLLQLASYLEFAPQLEILQVHMFYYKFSSSCWKGEVTGKGISFMHGLDHLKSVYMSGFRGFRAQVEFLCGILAKGDALEHVTIEPQVKLRCARMVNVFILEWEINEWARRLSERFGKAITVAPPVREPLGLFASAYKPAEKLKRLICCERKILFDG
ncbi:F-box/LRR-repeat protein At3g59210 isoform X2 [Setaria viridis]|uniref:F-box/LRR-repeat protein At3g59210 isoform X2 n=1 Tax=Setaria viridis TaxID=4556 RepID=UPI0014935261|nr:F-box/LRR-repeat protein At3g59210-like isoform X2 [Setaria viridis]